MIGMCFFHFPALEKQMATHSSVLAWRIPGTGEPGGLPSLGSHRVRHDWSDLACTYCHFVHWFLLDLTVLFCSFLLILLSALMTWCVFCLMFGLFSLYYVYLLNSFYWWLPWGSCIITYIYMIILSWWTLKFINILSTLHFYHLPA